MDELESLVEEIGALSTKLIILGNGTEKQIRLAVQRLKAHNGVGVINVGAELGRQLEPVPRHQRHLETARILAALIDDRGYDVALLDHNELLFDSSLKLDPILLLKRLARSRRVVSVWPGEFQSGRLLYARSGHPEHREYSGEGLVIFDFAKGGDR